MADLPELNEYPIGIYQLEQADPVLGGVPNEATGAGMDNIPHMQLAKRTNWLKARVDALLAQVVNATTAAAGIVQLSTSIGSTATDRAATSSAVKAAYDNAESRALQSTTIATAGLAQGGGNLAANRTITVPDATQAEAEAGTVSNKAMSPLRVAQAIRALSQSSRGGSGWQRLPTGLIIQWGGVDAAGSGLVTTTFPLAFPNACLCVIGSDWNGGSLNTATGASILVTGEYTQTNFRAYQQSHTGDVVTGGSSRYIAIGH